jgi:hypothetical protein
MTPSPARFADDVAPLCEHGYQFDCDRCHPVAEQIRSMYEMGKRSERDLIMAYLLDRGLGSIALEIARGAHNDG